MSDPSSTATHPPSSASPETTGPPVPVALPPDPAAYDDPRNVRARAKGMPTPYISGGVDPDPAKGQAEERYYGRLLLAMVIALILAGFVLGIALAIAINL